MAAQELVQWVENFMSETCRTRPTKPRCTTLFAQAGAVETVSVVRDMATGRARGFAFVEMGSDEEAQAAINQFNGVELGGRALTVNEARPKTPGGGGGYRRRRWIRWRRQQPSSFRAALVVRL